MRLDISANLTSIPQEIFDHADTLEILNLTGNQLSSLPDDFAKLHRLKILFCSENQFRHLPEVLGACPQLTMIGFKSNLIEHIPQAALPPQLRWFILTDNRLETLPVSLGRCKNLQKLMLAGNRLSHLPSGMDACTHLELIRLSANRFENFPPWLFELPRLAWLGLGGNPATFTTHQPSTPRLDWSHFQVSKKLGEGASGVIYQAKWCPSHPSTPHEVAIKVFKGGITSDGLPESEIATSLTLPPHPSLIRTLGEIHDHPSGQRALVMSLIGSEFTNLASPPSLETCTRDVFSEDVEIPAETVLQIALDLASVGSHLHQNGIMHGDFYAHNILWDRQAKCLLGDLGASSFYPAHCPAEKIEVRAFGILLGELLAHASGEPTPLHELQTLQNLCMLPPTQRPSFAEIFSAITRI